MTGSGTERSADEVVASAVSSFAALDVEDASTVGGLSLAGVPTASSMSEVTGGSLSSAGGVQFAVSGCSECVRSLVSTLESSLILEAAELTDIGRREGHGFGMPVARPGLC